MVTHSTSVYSHSNNPTASHSNQAERELFQPIAKAQPSQKALSPALGRLVLLAISIAVWGAAGLALSSSAQAQAGPYPPQRGGYGAGPQESSESVAELQRHLADMGYFNGEITGHYGSQTQEAVARFQQDMGLAADGIVGPETAQALFQGAPSGEPSSDPYESEMSEARAGVRLEDDGDQVAELQQRLADLGYYGGEISGVFDYPTEAAVMQFQRDNGLSTDGVVGPGTEDALRRPTEEIMRPAESPTPDAPTSEAETFDPQASNSVVPSSQDNLLRVGDSGQAVSELQARLQGLGFYQGEQTGLYDPETEAAVIAFQQSQGLTTDGIAGPQVNSALYNPANLTAANNAAPATAPAATTAVAPTGNSASDPAMAIPNATTTTAVAPTTTSPQPAPSAEQLQQEAEQARLEAEQARLEAEQARLMLNQNFSEGRYSVAELQRQLRDEGVYPGEISGVLDSGTRSAIVEAQRKHGLTQSDLSNLYGSAETSVAPSF